jgi:hypothetical protein
MAKAKLIMLKLEDKPGALAMVAGTLADAGVNIESVLGWGSEGAVQLVVDSPKKAMKALTAAGIANSEGKGEMAELANKPGSLHAHLKKLAKKGVNLRSITATSSKGGKKSVVIWTTDA